MKSGEWQKFKKNCPSKIDTVFNEFICGAKANEEYAYDEQFCKYQKQCPLLYLLKFNNTLRRSL